MKSHLKTTSIYLLKVLAAIAFLYWAFSGVENKGVLLENFQGALNSPGWLILGLVFAGVAVLASSLRLYILLKAQGLNVSYGHLCKLGFFASFFNIASLGTAAGDAVKMLGVMRRNPNKKMAITMITMMDHLVGFVSGSIIFLIFAWGGGIIDQVENTLIRQALIYATVFQLLGLFLVILMFGTSSEKRFKLFQAKLPRIANNEHVKSTANTVHVFQAQWRAALLALCVSIALSISFFMAFYVGLRTVGEQVAVGTVLTAMPVVDVVSSLPISISGLGVREKTFEFFLAELAGVPAATAVSASLIGFLFHVFWGLVGGCLFVFQRPEFLRKKST
ncbi:lysylphosphatidylglycerol synthase transmembrane domain-containing protein [Rubritalea sp.]|uniref:lysylphosphatidylglycerol synthase transmembrane domain-containing protein n=1 Tax=Rubritalea sp. TaxID=2109375 RepID=UPI003EF6A7F5